MPPEAGLSSLGFCSSHLLPMPGAGLMVGPSWLNFIKTLGSSYHFLKTKSWTLPSFPIPPSGGFPPSVRAIYELLGVLQRQRGPQNIQGPDRKAEVSDTSWGSNSLRMGRFGWKSQFKYQWSGLSKPLENITPTSSHLSPPASFVSDTMRRHRFKFTFWIPRGIIYVFPLP